MPGAVAGAAVNLVVMSKVPETTLRGSGEKLYFSIFGLG
jgi:hypothetical protein